MLPGWSLQSNITGYIKKKKSLSMYFLQETSALSRHIDSKWRDYKIYSMQVETKTKKE